MAAPCKVVFLDRDGVINKSPGAGRYVQSWEAFEFKAGALEMLSGLYSRGYRLVVVTNQQGIGKGLIAPQELQRIHDNMCAAIRQHGAKVDAVLHCPHLESQGCGCRKPKPGLILAALDLLGYEVDRDGSWMVGDSPRDVQAGQAAGLRTLLIGEAATGSANAPPPPCPVARVEQLGEVVTIIEQHA